MPNAVADKAARQSYFVVPAIRADVEKTSILNPGLPGFSEVLYAFTSAANNNGAAFAGLTASTPWFNTALGVAMFLGRFLPIVFVLALAGSLAQQGTVPATAGTLPTRVETIAAWIQGAQHIKPENRMPSFDVMDGETLDAMAAWLESLK